MPNIATTPHARMLGERWEEIVRLQSVFRTADETLHGDGESTEPERGLLFVLFADGAKTVPELARRRGQTRQRVQQIMNALEHRGEVARRANPASEKSPLYTVTAAGRRLALTRLRRETRFFRDLPEKLGPRRLRTTLAVLREFRDEIETRLES